MATTATVDCQIRARRTLSVGVENVTTADVHLKVGESYSFSSSTTPDVETVIAPRLALSSGTLTVDLTSVDDINGGTADLTGKKIRALYLKNRSASNTMTFAKGVSDGLATLSGSWSLVLLPGEERVINLRSVPDGSIGAISSSNKTIDVTGTDEDEFDLGIIAG